MTFRKKAMAFALSLIMAFSLSVTAFAENSSAEPIPYSALAHIVDNIFGILHDALFCTLERATLAKGIPTYEEYINTEHDYIYKGSDGKVTGNGWSAGFSRESVIPESWRCDANGKSDPNGRCLKILRATGGYQTFVSKMYTDQMMNMIILSNGTDSNKNGINDIIIFASVDGVGLTAGTCMDIRKNIEDALKSYNVTADDILACNLSATHCHAALDIQGMCIPTLFLNKLNPFTDYDRSLSQAMEIKLCSSAFDCAKEAYGKLEAGKLSFFETDEVSGANDKQNSGAKTKNYFSCFLFEGKSGEKTIISNIGAHPTSYGAWDSNKMMCADYPYFMALALKDAGYNIVFTQSAEASVSSPSIEYEDGDAKDVEASEWVSNYALSKEDWVELYGKKYADKWYDQLENSLEGHMKKGYLLAQHILNSADKSTEVAPVLNIKNAQTLLPLDNGVMAWGSMSGLLGENVVKTDNSKSGYGVMVETNYMEIGNDIAILTAPGELSPALVFGTDPDYNGTALWNGITSWTGETWKYDTLINTVRTLTGDSDKTVLLFGITNDALGYMFPDICTPKSMLATAIFYKENPGDMTNCMLMTVGTRCGSSIMEGYINTINK